VFIETNNIERIRVKRPSTAAIFASVLATSQSSQPPQLVLSRGGRGGTAKLSSEWSENTTLSSTFFKGSTAGQINSVFKAREMTPQMQGFKSVGSAQRFLSVHAATQNTFNVRRHLTSARTHRAFRASAVQTWREVVTAA
jgi:transposase-like protein